MLLHANNLTSAEVGKYWLDFQGNQRIGSLCVNMFFIITGYLMIASYKKQVEAKGDVYLLQNSGTASLNETLHKIKGILPDYVTGMLLVFIVYYVKQIATYFSQGKSPDLIAYFYKTFVSWIPEFVGLSETGVVDFKLNKPLWYISAMFLAFPILYFFLHKTKDTYIKITAPLLSLFLLGYVHQIYSGNVSSPATIGVIRAIQGMTSGAIAYLIAEHFNKKYADKHSVALTILQVALVAAIGYYIFGYQDKTYLMTTSLTIISPVLIAIIFSKKSYVSVFFEVPENSLGEKIYKTMGLFSLLLYINHANAWRLFSTVFKLDCSYEMALVAFYLVTFGVSLIEHGIVVAIRKIREKKQSKVLN